MTSLSCDAKILELLCSEDPTNNKIGYAMLKQMEYVWQVASILDDYLMADPYTMSCDEDTTLVALLLFMSLTTAKVVSGQREGVTSSRTDFWDPSNMEYWICAMGQNTRILHEGEKGCYWDETEYGWIYDLFGVERKDDRASHLK
jgi:hypothetical protein